MKRIYLLTILFFLTQLIHANNHLISYELKDSYPVEILQEKWKEAGIKEFITPVHHEVEVYEVMYWTKWHDGSDIKASGFYYVPKHIDEQVPTVVFHHGTKLFYEERVQLGGLQAVCVAFATDGYSVLFPHYIGIGKGDKFHLYQHADSEAQATIDMLRAVKEMNAELKLYTNEQLFLTGYSQGGHATLAAHKKIQEEYSDEFTVTASSPMSGAYDMTGAQSTIMFEPYSHPGYLPYVLTTLDEVYDIWPGDIYEIFKEPYDSVVRTMLNKQHRLKELTPLLPEVPADMILDTLVEEFKNNPDFIFTQRLAENNVYDWKPEAPVMLCYCNADEQVNYENAFVAHDAMKANGAKRVILRNGGKKYGHNKCALFSSMYTKFFFDSIKKGKKKGRKGPLFKRFLIALAKIKVKP